MTTTGRRGHGANTELMLTAHIHLNTICQQLRERRRELRITQTEIAQALAVNTATITNWENGHRPPLAPNLLAWATYLDVKIGVLTSETSNDAAI